MNDNTSNDAPTGTALNVAPIESPIARAATITVDVTVEMTTLLANVPTVEAVKAALSALASGQSVYLPAAGNTYGPGVRVVIRSVA